MAELKNARWDEAARLAGYESLTAAHMAGFSFVIINGTGEIVVIKQKDV